MIIHIKSLRGHMVLFFLGRYVGVELLGLCLAFWEAAKLLSKGATLFCIPTNNVRRFSIDFKVFILYVIIFWLNNFLIVFLWMLRLVCKYCNDELAFQLKISEVKKRNVFIYRIKDKWSADYIKLEFRALKGNQEVPLSAMLLNSYYFWTSWQMMIDDEWW